MATRAANPTKRMKEEWQREARAAYGLAPDALAEVDAALEEAAAGVHHQVGGGETARSARLPLISLLGARGYHVGRYLRSTEGCMASKVFKGAAAG